MVTQIHNNEDDITRIILLRSLCFSAPSLLRGIPRMHDDEDEMTTARTLLLHTWMSFALVITRSLLLALTIMTH